MHRRHFKHPVKGHYTFCGHRATDGEWARLKMVQPEWVNCKRCKKMKAAWEKKHGRQKEKKQKKQRTDNSE